MDFAKILNQVWIRRNFDWTVFELAVSNCTNRDVFFIVIRISVLSFNVIALLILTVSDRWPAFFSNFIFMIQNICNTSPGQVLFTNPRCFKSKPLTTDNLNIKKFYCKKKKKKQLNLKKEQERAGEQPKQRPSFLAQRCQCILFFQLEYLIFKQTLNCIVVWTTTTIRRLFCGLEENWVPFCKLRLLNIQWIPLTSNTPAILSYETE